MNLAELKTALLQRIGELYPNNATPVFFTDAEATTALNSSQRIFVFGTLCLEAEDTLTLGANTTWANAFDSFDNYLLPLRVRTSDDVRVRPARLSELDALDPEWSTRIALGEARIERYAACGFGMLAFYKQHELDRNLTVTFARSATALADDADIPEVDEEYHDALVDLSMPLLRMKEGDSELTKTLPYFGRGVEAMKREAARVRVRNASYDHQPPELARFDLSKLIKPRRANVVQPG